MMQCLFSFFLNAFGRLLVVRYFIESGESYLPLLREMMQ